MHVLAELTLPLLLLCCYIAPSYAEHTPSKRNRLLNKLNNKQHLLEYLQKRTDVYLGVAVSSHLLAQSEKDDSLRCLRPNMNMAVPTYEMKWDPIAKDGPGKWNTQPVDDIMKWLKRHDNRAFRGHCGLWDQSTPDWVKNLDKNALRKAIYDHVYYIVHHFADSMVSFDVINEPLKYDNSGDFKNSVFWDVMSYEMFTIAYKAADDARKATGSKLKLFLNELDVETGSGNSQKRKAFVALVDDLKKWGVPIDGIGLQGHFNSEKLFSLQELEEGLKLFTDRGYEVGFTELDVRLRDDDYSESTLKNQAQQYANVYEACLRNSACKMVVRWGVSDTDSWIPNFFDGWGRATLFGKDCAPKPRIMKAILAVLRRY